MTPVVDKSAASILRTTSIILACATIGVAIGISVAFHATEARLIRYADHLVDYADTYSDEVNSTLKIVNASPFPFCSDEDINRLRDIIFHGHLVKDIGRVRDQKLYCTGVAGRLASPIAKATPDITTSNGISVWLNINLVAAPGMYGDITQSGEADFVASHDLFGHLQRASMTYTTTLSNRQTGQVLRTAGDPMVLNSKEILAQKFVIRHEALYYSHCSTRNAPCMIAGIPIREAVRSNTPLIAGFLILGSLAGFALSSTVLLHPRRRSLAVQLRRALRRNLITVVYQPIVDVKNGRIVGAEALARWTDEDGRYIPPDIFVKAAEELGFIGKLTRVVLEIILEELSDYLRTHPDFHVNVNIAAADLADRQFLPMLEKTLAKYKVSPASINLELTERSTADHPLAISAIHMLRERGHEFYIDDFGTGYSSLSYLNELSVDAIKIDRAFTDAIGTGSLTAVIVPQILAMARTLGVKVVVEGVERAEQSEYFANLNQEILAQGWHFGEAIPLQDLMVLMESKSALHLVHEALQHRASA